MEEPLLESVARSEPKAFERCIDRYGGLVWSIARRYSANDEDAEEAVQDVFVALWKSAHRYDPERIPEKHFITMIARRRLIDRLRGRARRPDLVELDHREPADARWSSSPESTTEIDSVDRLMQHLSDEQREILSLSVFEGMSQSEIAERTRLPLGTVKSHARRGLLRMREVIELEEGPR